MATSNVSVAYTVDRPDALMAQRTEDDIRLGELMRRAQSGDADAYLCLLEEVVPRVRDIVARRGRGRSQADVEDLVQDVLLSVHVARATYDPRRPFVPWLLAITRHRLADGARRFARRDAREVQVEDLDVTFSSAATHSTLDDSAETADLRQAMAALPVKQREAIQLLKLEELSLKEAAVVTGTSVGALKVATHRAIATLRRLLARDGTKGR